MSQANFLYYRIKFVYLNKTVVCVGSRLNQESVNGHHTPMTNGTSMETECDSRNGFRLENLMAVIQIVTDAIAVR